MSNLLSNLSGPDIVMIIVVAGFAIERVISAWRDNQ